MKEILKLIKDESFRSSLIVIVIVVGYFGKVYLDDQIGSVNDRLMAITSSSLNIEEDLRASEREALVEFRLSIEE